MIPKLFGESLRNTDCGCGLLCDAFFVGAVADAPPRIVLSDLYEERVVNHLQDII